VYRKREVSRGQARYLSSQVLLYSTASCNSPTPNFLLQTLNPKHNFLSARKSLLWSLFDCLKSYYIGFVDRQYLTRLLLNLLIIATKVGISFSLYPLFFCSYIQQTVLQCSTLLCPTTGPLYQLTGVPCRPQIV
jgi:hypothetical protein